MTAIAILHRDQIIQQVASGELIRDIAPQFGISPEAISQQLARDPEYVEARRAGTEQRLEACETEIRVAPDVLSLARGRERFRVVSWRAEREFPDLYAQRSHITVEHVQLGDRLRRSQERTIPVCSATDQSISDAEIIPK